MFRPKAPKGVYRFSKKHNNEGVEVNTLYNYKNKPVYRAYVTKIGRGENTYCFHNILNKKRTAHTVGITTDNADVSNYRKATFDFDGIDIWERLARLGTTLRLTNVNEYDSVYRIFQDSEELGSARMHASSKGEKTISIESDATNTQLLFIIFFTIARIY